MPINIDDILDPVEQLSIARDTLRGRASDYFRMSLLDPSVTGGLAHRAIVEAEIEEIQAHVARLEETVPDPPVLPAPEPAPEAPAEPAPEPAPEPPVEPAP